MDTIFAVSSGQPPAAIAVMRISGPRATYAAVELAGSLPPARQASLRTLHDGAGEMLDQALVLFFPGPRSSTGEDVVELHLHGGRAVVAAVMETLGALPGLRVAQPGEFTRRALENGCLDFIQAEGLADLLEAETEAQRRVALAASEGRVSRQLGDWLHRLSGLSAMIEVQLDHAEEDDVPAFDFAILHRECDDLRDTIAHALDQPTVERLRDGALVVLAGPPNAGKSSLFNALLERDAAIVTPIAGTTRDVLEAAVVRDGAVYRLVDTAGLNAQTEDPIELLGIGRALQLLETADLILWLGPIEEAPPRSLLVHGKADIMLVSGTAEIEVSIHRDETIRRLWEIISARVDTPMSGQVILLRDAQRRVLGEVIEQLTASTLSTDLLLLAEHIRVASRSLATLLGRDATEDMLDALFGRFCLGK